MTSRQLKYILDIERVIQELIWIQDRFDNDFEKFKSDFMGVRAAERAFEILGEALNKLQKIEPKIEIKNAAEIIGLRNLIAHAYDTIDVKILWSILIQDIPNVKEEIDQLKN
ncbi:DUF86 domain-containing protein [Roseivirga sp.]|uniref:HepT-like ribonuclease domain-containing protein n=1 Tax=Roseivirga sp. TaxID=1964215 RepID=UPI002B26FD96|nr:HepT-like ribonuclease domain-containing protein [Roseivirga sp.]